MAVTVVQHKTGGAGPGTSASVTVTATGAGNLLVAAIMTDGLSTDVVNSVSDGSSNFAQVSGALATNGGQRTDVWWLASSNSGKTSITVTMNQSTFLGIEIWEVSGITSPVVDIAGVVNTGAASGTTASGASVTPSAPQFGVGAISCNNTGVAANPLAGNEFSSGGDINTFMNGAACSLLTTTAVSHQPAWTETTGSNSFCATTVFFKSANSPVSITFYASNPIQSGSNAGLLATAAPTASTSTTGWTVGTTGVQRYSRQTYNVEVPTTGFTATVQPSGAPVTLAQDCWRTSAATTGDFSAGTWYSSVSVIAVTNASSQRGAALFRIWRSVNFDGTSATEITKSRMTGSTLASNLLTTVAQSSSASTQIAAFSLANEYLFWQVAWSSTTTATNVGADVLIRMGNMGTTGSGSGLVTSIFSSTAGAGGGAVSGAYYYMMMADWFNR